MTVGQFFLGRELAFASCYIVHHRTVSFVVCTRQKHERGEGSYNPDQATAVHAGTTAVYLAGPSRVPGPQQPLRELGQN